jgi:hypothetical protein
MTEPSSPSPEHDQVELAFEAMQQRLAGLTAAMDGFAVRQQELHGRDYGPDLEKINESFQRVREAAHRLADKPALKLTPEDVARQIEKAGQESRQVDHAAWGNAQSRLERATQSIEKVVASALAFRVQRNWIAGSAAAALVVGLILGERLPGWIDGMVPESWHWPEASAANMLGQKEWEAGFRLLQVADPAEWQRVVRAINVYHDNAQNLADCNAEALKIKGLVDCKIQIGPQKVDPI